LAGTAVHVFLAFDAEADSHVADRVVRVTVGIGAARHRALTENSAAALLFLLAMAIDEALHAAPADHIAEGKLAPALGDAETFDASSRVQIALTS